MGLLGLGPAARGLEGAGGQAGSLALDLAEVPKHLVSGPFTLYKELKTPQSPCWAEFASTDIYM